ncbi:hypothetical protein SODG_001250 [Sodalis praecaptivus]
MPQRLLEVNTPLIWHWPHVLSLLETLQRYRFTGLIIHQQTILALLAPPRRLSRARIAIIFFMSAKARCITSAVSVVFAGSNGSRCGSRGGFPQRR